MKDGQLPSFSDPVAHARVSDIIRRRSTNPADVRDAALEGLDLSFAGDVLDLGCGFGFMSEAVARRAAPGAEITGVELCATNEKPFLERVAATGRRGRFLARRNEERLEFRDRSFDLVVASYALYFFPRLVPEIARVLRPHGLFVAVTHTEASCRDLLRAAGLPASDSRMLGDIRAFSAENGEALLAPWFSEIERVDYRNSLVFEREDHDDFLAYLRFKLPLIPLAAEGESRFAGRVENAIRTGPRAGERVVFLKDDAAFRCRGPRWR